MPIAPASRTRETRARSGAMTVTTGAIPLSQTKVRNVDSRLSSVNACSGVDHEHVESEIGGDFDDGWCQCFEDVDAEYRIASVQFLFRVINDERLFWIHLVLTPSLEVPMNCGL